MMQHIYAVHESVLPNNIYPTRCNVTQFILYGNCSTCFGWYLQPSLGAQTTVSTASGVCHTVSAATVWQIPDAVDTLVCAPDDGCWYDPKYVEQFPDKINCVTLYLVGYILEYLRSYSINICLYFNTVRTGSFKLFKRPFPGFI